MTTELDQIITEFQRMSEMAQIRDLRREARATIEQRCGNCQHWMKTRICPLEETRQPDSGYLGCEKYLQEPYVKALYDKRMSEIERRESLLAPPPETA